MRLIDADALERDADYDDGEYWAYSAAQIEDAPTIEERKTGRWIPVTERLPEDSNFYLVTRKDFLVRFIWYSVLHGWEWQEEEQPIAWMPLPEPWRGEPE